MVKFDKHKLLYNQIGRLTEALDRKDTTSQDRQNHQSITGKGRGYRQFPSHDRGKGNYSQMSYDRNRRDIFLLDPNEEDIIPQVVPITGRAITNIGVIADDPGVEVHPDPTRRPRFVSRSPSRDDDRCFSCRTFCCCARKCPEKETSVTKV